jgi:hypothetical protein
MNRAKTRRQQHEPGHTNVFGAEPPKRRISLRLVMLVAMILVVAGGIVGLSVAVPDKTATTALGITGLGQGIPSLANNSGISNPRAYQYDPVNNQYWDPRPGHVHWHPGQPPANVATGTPALGGTTIINSGLASGDPDIANPTPWQYDPATNKHWHPDHGHWHNGPVPAGK